MTQLYPIYYGNLASQNGTLYRIEILSPDSSNIPTEDRFPVDTPIEIEWQETSKLDPVQGSSLTLKLLSESDRHFINLYQVAVGSVVCRLYRNGALYWTGTLDPEFYEEPYSYKSDYEVSVTFSDFAILDRLKWNKKGLLSLQQLIDYALSNLYLGDINIPVDYCISTLNADTGELINFNEIYLSCDNFYDEDDEPMTFREVLEGALQPFALRLLQKNGSFTIYDLNAVYNDSTILQQVYWTDTDAMLGVDNTYNNIVVTFSPYADAEIIDASLDHDETLKGEDGFLYYTDSKRVYNEDDFDDVAPGFTIANGSDNGAKHPITLFNGARFFRIDSIYSGSDDAGIAWQYKRPGRVGDQKVIPVNDFTKVWNNGPGTTVLAKIIAQSKPAFIGTDPNHKDKFKLKISLSALIDVRYNPFESASKHNKEEQYDKLQNWSNFAYIPVKLELLDSEGTVLYHYNNADMVGKNGYNNTIKGWITGDAACDEMFLCYYDWDNRKDKSGLGGWAKNKQTTGYYRDGSFPSLWEERGDGEFIELPPCGGWLRFTICSGLYQIDYNLEEKNIQQLLYWSLYKNPQVSLVKAIGSDIDDEDIEDSAWINRDAEEELTIDTIIGTPHEHYPPSARGVVMDNNMQAITKFSRAGNTDRLERLLIATVYSQYATRMATISGLAKLIPQMAILTEASSSGKFLITSERQNIIEDSAEIKMVEFVPDDFIAVEYKD